MSINYTQTSLNSERTNPILQKENFGALLELFPEKNTGQRKQAQRFHDRELDYLLTPRQPSGRRERNYQTHFGLAENSQDLLNLFLAPAGSTVVSFGPVDDRHAVYYPGDFSLTTREVYNTQAEARDAWDAKLIPPQSVCDGGHTARVRSGATKGTHRSDGSGVLNYHGNLASVRTVSGLTINNSDLEQLIRGRRFRRGRYGDGHNYTRSKKADISLPLSSLEQALRQSRSRRDVPEWESVTKIHGSISGDRYPVVIEFADGTGVIVIHDRTANGRGLCSMDLTADQLESLPTPDSITEWLKPEEVREAEKNGMRIFEDVPRDHHIGLHYNYMTDSKRMEHTSDYIIRQGEWFFVPMPSDFEPDGYIFKPQSRKLVANTLEDVVFTTGKVPPYVEPTTVLRDEPAMKDPETGIYYVRSELLRTYQNPARDYLGNHVPRDFAPITIEDPESDNGSLKVVGGFVRGTIRHANGDHPMINLKERWFKAIRHNQPVMSLEAARPRLD